MAESDSPLTDPLDCGFCGLHVSIHPRYRTLESLSDSREKHWDNHAWVDIETARALMRAFNEGWRITEEAVREPA